MHSKKYVKYAIIAIKLYKQLPHSWDQQMTRKWYFRLSEHTSTYMSPALRTRPQDSRFFSYNNSSRPESQRILFDNHCQISGKIIDYNNIAYFFGTLFFVAI